MVVTIMLPKTKDIAASKVFNDQITTIAELRRQVKDFVAVREWQQFHSPKNLSMAIAVEAAELLDLFKWQTENESKRLSASGRLRTALAEELADILIFELAFANSIDLDLSKAVLRKLMKNKKKYPARIYKGKYTVD